MAADSLAKRSRFEIIRNTFGLVAHGAIACAPRTAPTGSPDTPGANRPSDCS
jgi:hypothetical protein